MTPSWEWPGTFESASTLANMGLTYHDGMLMCGLRARGFETNDQTAYCDNVPWT